MPNLPVPRPGPAAFVAAMALSLGVLPVTGALPAFPAAAHPATAPGAGDTGGTHTVTLITGDEVSVAASERRTTVRSVKPSGRRTAGTAGYHTVVTQGETYVFPASVLPYISSGRLDKQLFNVTRLIADGYDDEHTDRLPLIVRYTGDAAKARDRVKLAGSITERRLDSITSAAVTERRTQASAFWAALTHGPGATPASSKPAFSGGVAKVWLDGRVTADLADSTAQIGAPRVWAQGNTGKGVKVAVLDSGADLEHPDLAGQVDGTATFVPTDEDVTDTVGHGTHVASTVAGTGAASDGRERGVAPGARLSIGKVLNPRGQGQQSWIIAGMEWAAREERAKVISMSLGGQGDGTDPLSQAVDDLSAETGALFVVAAGNSGPGAHSVGSPGAADAALTVGAVDSSDRLADFSSRGPRSGDDGLKPEVTAPGVDILAARSKDSSEGTGPYTTMSGTSMATPHVAGAAALLAAAHPDWTGRQLKEALVSSARATGTYTPYEAGAGRVDADAAVRASVFATASAFGGFHSWPTAPGATDVRTVTYTNTGDTEVGLDLAVDARVAADAFSVSERRVTVPAHGTRSVELTTNIGRIPADRPVSGMLVATDGKGDVRARTLIGGSREGERHDLTIVAKDRSGEPIAGASVLLSTKNLWSSATLDDSGRATLRVPAGEYSGWLFSTVTGANGSHARGLALLSFQNTRVDQDRTVTLDGRGLRQVRAEVPQTAARLVSRLDVAQEYGDSSVSTVLMPDDTYDSIWALPSARQDGAGFTFGARFRLEQPALTLATGSRVFDEIMTRRGVTPLPAGTHRLEAVYGGGGSAGELAAAGVRGRAVVVRRSDDLTPLEQASAAAEAGARLVVIVHDGVGRLLPTPDGIVDPGAAPLSMATLDADQGAGLLAAVRRGGETLTVTSNPTTDYLYDVVRHWSGGVPADPTWRERRHDLVPVDVSFRNYRPGDAYEFRSDEQGFSGVWVPLPAPAQGRRTDWLSADIPWQDYAGIFGEMSQRLQEFTTYRRGTTGQVSWFGPVQRPRMGPLGSLPVRYGDTMWLPVPGWGDSGSGHIGDSHGNFGVKNLMTLYQGDRELDQGNIEKLLPSGLAPQRLPYRLVVDNDRGKWASPYSRHTLTEWNFTSQETGTETTLPLIQLDYGVRTDPAGRADRNGHLIVTASHLPGVTGTVKKPSVELSYDDGATWRRAALDRHGDGWRTVLRAPKRATFVTVRVAARDDDGNSVSQTLVRAFGLR
ncbi:S8 family serine peptidase [Streptomyces sp. NPDC059805]|uniref:S8 family serine peptidase n=1 Tax=Streptomyces sp. NPDC059805 TaxID=3346954 RepID=UPI0036472855